MASTEFFAKFIFITHNRTKWATLKDIWCARSKHNELICCTHFSLYFCIAVYNNNAFCASNNIALIEGSEYKISTAFWHIFSSFGLKVQGSAVKSMVRSNLRSSKSLISSTVNQAVCSRVFVKSNFLKAYFVHDQSWKVYLKAEHVLMHARRCTRWPSFQSYCQLTRCNIAQFRYCNENAVLEEINKFWEDESKLFL